MRFPLVLSVLLTCVSVIAQEVTPGAEHQISQLIEQLGNDEFSQRQAASEGLRSIGRPALPQLFEATKGDDPEVAIRAYWLYARLKCTDTVEPTRVSLTGKGLQARAVFEEISRQSVTPVQFCNEGEMAFHDTLIDVDFRNVPYWEAFLQTCRLSNNTCYQQSVPHLRLRGGTEGLEHYTSAGPLLFKFSNLTYGTFNFVTDGIGERKMNVSHPILSVDFYVFWEGRFQSERCRSAIVRSCLTDRGEMEIFAPSNEYEFICDRPEAGTVDWVRNTATLPFPDEGAKIIRELKGELPVFASLEFPRLSEFRPYQTWVTIPFTLRDIPLKK